MSIYVEPDIDKPLVRALLKRQKDVMEVIMGPIDGDHQPHPGVEELVMQNMKLLESGKHSDFVVRCGSREWKLHSQIVCPRSRFFDSCLNSEFEVVSLPYNCLDIFCYPQLRK
ncbi:MAG: hypothetical protein Q9214_008061 [Letrouitia sp. 1 TL-2023]